VQKGEVVRMGDDYPCDIVGVGSVQIKAHDGMTRTMQNVRYILGMSRNLISLSTLDAEGFKYSGSGGVLKASKGSLVCLVGDMNSAKLYIRRGSILHGSISAIAAVIDDKPCETNLWHMRLLTPKFGKESDLWVQLDEESVWQKEGFFRCIRQKNPWSAICFHSAREQLS
jgi:hypothetical protein